MASIDESTATKPTVDRRARNIEKERGGGDALMKINSGAQREVRLERIGGDDEWRAVQSKALMRQTYVCVCPCVFSSVTHKTSAMILLVSTWAGEDWSKLCNINGQADGLTASQKLRQLARQTV